VSSIPMARPMCEDIGRISVSEVLIMTKKERNAFLSEMGVCTHCGKRMAAKDHKLCLSCLDMHKIIYEQRKADCKLWYQTHKEEMKAIRKEKYHARKDKGLCVTCGKKAIEGMVRCEKCRRIYNTERRRNYGRERSRQSC